MKTIVTIFYLLAPFYSFAQGDAGGNGGDAMLCSNKPVVLLDSYEAEKNLKLSVNLDDQKSYLTLTQELIDRVKSKDPIRGDQLQSYFDDAKPDLISGKPGKEVDFTRDPLTEIPDEIRIKVPCPTQQLVIQINPKQRAARSAWGIQESRYTIYEPLWEVMSESQKAITLTHEFWYRELLEYGATDSLNARALNATFFTDRYRTLNFQQYVDILKKTEFFVDRVRYEKLEMNGKSGDNFKVLITTPIGNLYCDGNFNPENFQGKNVLAFNCAGKGPRHLRTVFTVLVDPSDGAAIAYQIYGSIELNRVSVSSAYNHHSNYFYIELNSAGNIRKLYPVYNDWGPYNLGEFTIHQKNGSKSVKTSIKSATPIYLDDKGNIIN